MKVHAAMAACQASYISWLKQVLGEVCKLIITEKSQIFIIVKPRNLKLLMLFLKKNTNCQFKSLSELFAVDYPSRKKRFEVIFILLSFRFCAGVGIKVHLEAEEACPSITQIFSGAGWYEREVFDLFGVFFSGNPDLRRLLTDYGFEGHALRKDFPLAGFYEVSYSYDKKRVFCKPASFSQTFRNFFFIK